ncbi:MAG: NUDIX hydrolase N-terminal domain-containing protein [Anaerolineae bacterium]
MLYQDDLYQIADELRTTAGMGLHFAENGYDRERYERVMHAAAHLLALAESRSPEEIYPRLLDTLHHLSPMSAVEMVVWQGDQLLLIQRHDDRLWALPGGLIEVGETPAEAGARELWEEAGVRGQITRLLGIFDSRRWQTETKTQLLSILFEAEALGERVSRAAPSGEIGPLAESLDVRFFAEDALPPLSRGHHLRVPFLFKLHRGEVDAPYFDR